MKDTIENTIEEKLLEKPNIENNSGKFIDINQFKKEIAMMMKDTENNITQEMINNRIKNIETKLNKNSTTGDFFSDYLFGKKRILSYESGELKQDNKRNKLLNNYTLIENNYRKMLEKLKHRKDAIILVSRENSSYEWSEETCPENPKDKKKKINQREDYIWSFYLGKISNEPEFDKEKGRLVIPTSAQIISPPQNSFQPVWYVPEDSENCGLLLNEIYLERWDILNFENEEEKTLPNENNLGGIITHKDILFCINIRLGKQEIRECLGEEIANAAFKYLKS